MKQGGFLLSLLATLFIFGHPFCTAQRAESTEADGQYIFYNGTVSGHVSYGPGSSCSQYELKQHAKTYLYIGVYPPWDPNPFFFDFYHLRTEEYDGMPGGENEEPPAASKRQFTSITYDTIFNLWFSTASYVCFKDNHVCGNVEVNPYYVGIDLIDLKAAKTERATIGSEQGYTVTGDQRTWVSNNTIQNLVDIASPCFRAGDRWIWNSSTPFTYNITFTNTTATATLALSYSAASLVLNFTGKRVSYFESIHSTYYRPGDPSNDSGLEGNLTVALDTSDPHVPKFTWANGSAIYFENPYGSWEAVASPPASTTTTSATATPTGGAIGGVGMLNSLYLVVVLVVMSCLF